MACQLRDIIEYTNVTQRQKVFKKFTRIELNKLILHMGKIEKKKFQKDKIEKKLHIKEAKIDIFSKNKELGFKILVFVSMMRQK